MKLDHQRYIAMEFGCVLGGDVIWSLTIMLLLFWCLQVAMSYRQSLRLEEITKRTFILKSDMPFHKKWIIKFWHFVRFLMSPINMAWTLCAEGQPRHISIILSWTSTGGFREEEYLSSDLFLFLIPQQPIFYIYVKVLNVLWWPYREHICEALLKSDQLQFQRRGFKRSTDDVRQTDAGRSH